MNWNPRLKRLLEERADGASGVVAMGKMWLTGFPAWVIWLFAHIFFLIGHRNRFIVMFQWALAYFSFKRTARIILSDTTA